MKKLLVVFIFFMTYCNQIQSQVTTAVLPCAKINSEKDIKAIKLKLVFNEDRKLIQSVITSVPEHINCNSKYYVYTTIDNQSLVEIDEIRITNLLPSEIPTTIRGGINPIIIKPIPSGCTRSLSEEPVDFRLLEELATPISQLVFTIKNKSRKLLSTIQKEFEYTGNTGELKIRNATASIVGKLDIRWNIINNGCDLKTPFTSNVYSSTDSIFDKNDTLIATRNTILSSNTGSEHIAILHSFINYEKNRFVIIEVDSKNEIIESNELNNTVTIEAFKNKAPVVYPQPVVNTVNFTYETKRPALAVIYIFDQFGILRKAKKYRFKKNRSTCIINLSQLKSGLYFYKMIVNDTTYFGDLIKK